jgi:hypothetical protein
MSLPKIETWGTPSYPPDLGHLPRVGQPFKFALHPMSENPDLGHPVFILQTLCCSRYLVPSAAEAM